MKGTPANNFPAIGPTVKLAEKKAKEEKHNTLCKASFPFETMSDYQPQWAVEQVCDFTFAFALVSCMVWRPQASTMGEDNSEEKQDVPWIKKNNTKRLDFMRWLVAFQCFALAAAAVGVSLSVWSPRWPCRM